MVTGKSVLHFLEILLRADQLRCQTGFLSFVTI